MKTSGKSRWWFTTKKFTLTISILLASNLVKSSFNPYFTNDCFQCKSNAEAYYCNFDNRFGVCCPEGTDHSLCQPVKEENRQCSNAVTADFYYGYCMNSTASRCSSIEQITINADFSEQTLEVSNISRAQYQACAYQIYHRTNGFLRFGGQALEIKFSDLSNLDIIVASGSNMGSLTQVYSNADIKMDEWITFAGTDWIYIAAIPQINLAQNHMSLSYKYKNLLEARRKYSEQLLANDIQLAITWGGLAFILLVLGLVILYRRYKLKKLQQLKEKKKGESDNSVIEENRGLTEGDKSYSKVLDKSL
eukprot:403366161